MEYRNRFANPSNCGQFTRTEDLDERLFGFSRQTGKSVEFRMKNNDSKWTQDYYLLYRRNPCIKTPTHAANTLPRYVHVQVPRCACLANQNDVLNTFAMCLRQRLQGMLSSTRLPRGASPQQSLKHALRIAFGRLACQHPTRATSCARLVTRNSPVKTYLKNKKELGQRKGMSKITSYSTLPLSSSDSN